MKKYWWIFRCSLNFYYRTNTPWKNSWNISYNLWVEKRDFDLENTPYQAYYDEIQYWND